MKIKKSNIIDSSGCRRQLENPNIQNNLMRFPSFKLVTLLHSYKSVNKRCLNNRYE